MRSIYILSGRPSAKLESGFMVDSRGQTVGMDLWVEVKPNEWVPADKLPPGTLSSLKDTGQLQHGIYYEGKLYTTLEVPNTLHKLIAAKEGLEKAFQERQTEIKGTTSFKASEVQTQIVNPLDELIKQIEQEVSRLEELKKIEAEVQQLEHEVEKLEKQQKETIKPEDVEPHHLDFLTDLTRAWHGKTLSTQSLELLCRAQRVSELAGEDLLLNPNKMRALRDLLVS